MDGGMEYKGVERRKRVRTPEVQKMDSTFVDVRKDAARFAIEDAAQEEADNRKLERGEALRARKEELEAEIEKINLELSEMYPDSD